MMKGGKIEEGMKTVYYPQRFSWYGP